MMEQLQKKRLAIVIPCYNEADNLVETTHKLTSVLEDLIYNKSWISEDSYILFVNEIGYDNSWELIQKLHSNNKFVAGLNLGNGAGHQNSLMAGLLEAKDNSDITISMDADLQNDIRGIYDMLRKFNEGYHIVYGVRTNRKTESHFKKVSVIIFYKLMKYLGANITLNHADFRLLSNDAVRQLSMYTESNLFLRGIVTQLGLPAVEIEYEVLDRVAGESKYSFSKMLKLASDGITSFSIKPIRLIFSLGILFLILSILYSIYSVYQYIVGNTISGWTSTILSIWFIGSLTLISLGIIGEYIGKVYLESKRRPRYNIISKLLN